VCIISPFFEVENLAKLKKKKEKLLEIILLKKNISKISPISMSKNGKISPGKKKEKEKKRNCTLVPTLFFRGFGFFSKNSFFL
jgi:hypothetical protein